MLREEEFLSPLGRRQVRQELQVRLKVRESSFNYLCSQLGLKESESQRAAWCRGALKARVSQATAAHCLYIPACGVWGKTWELRASLGCKRRP